MFSFLKNGAHIFKKKQEDILSAAFVITLSYVISKLLGLVRIRLLTAHFGSQQPLLASYFAASTLPDSIFEVLIFGTIALAFIPVFSKYLAKDNQEKAWQIASTLISLSFIIFLILAVIFFFFSKNFAPILAPGLIRSNPETKIIIAHLLQIIVFAQMFFVISIFLTGILQSFQHFLVPALASVFYNIGIILSIIFLVPVFGIYAPAIGMIFGALLHLLIQLPLVQSLGFKFRPNLDLGNKDVREMLGLMWPRSITIGLTRLSEIINTALASLAGAASIVALNLAQILQLVPITFFAASISQAAFAFLSIEFNKEKGKEYKKLLIESLHQILFLVLPATAILAILRIPVVRLVFGAREFPWETTVLTARVLMAFCVGISAQAVNLLLIRGFHAARDSMTPLKISMATTLANIAASLVIIFVLHHSIIWLALSYSSANILASILLLYFLDKKIGGFDRRALLMPIFKMGTISILTAIALYVPMKLLDQLVFDTTRTINLILLTSIATAVGLAVYVLLSLALNINEAYVFWAFIKRVTTWPKKIFTPPSVESQKQLP